MIIKYQFADGTTSEVEVSEEIGAYITASRREESNGDRKQRYHCISLDGFEYEGEAFADESQNQDRIREEEESQSKVDKFLSTLTAVQRRRLERRLDGASAAQIAREEHCDPSVVRESLKQIKAKYKKLF